MAAQDATKPGSPVKVVLVLVVETSTSPFGQVTTAVIARRRIDSAPKRLRSQNTFAASPHSPRPTEFVRLRFEASRLGAACSSVNSRLYSAKDPTSAMSGSMDATASGVSCN